MKLFVFVAALIFSAAAHAQLAVGTWATYNMTITLEDGRTLTAQETAKVLAVNNDGTSLVEYTLVEAGGKTTVDEKVEQTNNLMNEKTAETVVAHCATPQINGAVEDITVAAGAFKSCKLINQQTSTWVAAVPFGLVKIVSPGTLDENGKQIKGVLTGELAAHGK